MGGLNQSLIRGDQLKVVALSDGQVQGIGATQSRRTAVLHPLTTLKAQTSALNSLPLAIIRTGLIWLYYPG